MSLLKILAEALQGIYSLFLSVSSISGFPPRLSAAEERKYIEAWSGGDRSARQKLIEHNLRLVAHVSKKYASAVQDPDDLISIGTIGLIKAVETYDGAKNIKLATYASRCIENEILMHLRKLASRRAEVSFDEPLNADADGNELLLSDVLGTDGEEISRPLEDDADRQALHSAVERLSPR